jgi:hypothetical protein
MERNKHTNRSQMLVAPICHPSNWEAEIGRIPVSGQKSKILKYFKYSKIIRAKWRGDEA